MYKCSVGHGNFWPQDHYLKKLNIGQLDDVSYQISRLLALWFQKRRFFHVFSIKTHVKHVNLRTGLFLAPVAYFEQI